MSMKKLFREEKIQIINKPIKRISTLPKVKEMQTKINNDASLHNYQMGKN